MILTGSIPIQNIVFCRNFHRRLKSNDRCDCLSAQVLVMRLIIIYGQHGHGFERGSREIALHPTAARDSPFLDSQYRYEDFTSDM